MNQIIENIQSSDTKLRHNALETILLRLKGNENKLVDNDTNIRLYSSIISLIKDANPKIVMTSLEITQLLIESHSEIFTPLINMSFELLIGKFSDSKAIIRNKATDIMISLINLIGLVSGFEKLSSNLSNKNFRIREQLLITILKLFDLYDEDIMFMPNLIPKMSILLNDSQNSVRQIAINIFAKLYNILGDSIFSELEAEGIKPNQLILIQSAIENGPNEILTMDDIENDFDINIDAPPIVDTMKSSSPSSIRSKTKSPKVEQIIDQNDKTTNKVNFKNNNIRASSVGRQRASSTNSSSSALVVVPTSSNNSSNKSNATSSSKSEQEAVGNVTFASASYMNLLGEGNEVKSISVYSEKELTKIMTDIIQGLKDVDDWQARMKALGLLQGLTMGDGIEFDSFITQLKGCHELLINQISDLRSIVMKEACRTVGFLAYRLGHNFSLIAELLLPVLMKQVVVKIQVMSSAADRCIRIIIKSALQGFPRIITQFLDNCISKTPTLRKCSYEYLCLAAALWKIEILEKSLGLIKNVLKSGMNDADLNTRKAARQLFWVLRSRSQWKVAMDSFLLELEPSTQKHALAEFQNSSTEFLELIENIGKPLSLESGFNFNNSNNNKEENYETIPSSNGQLNSNPRNSVSSKKVQKNTKNEADATTDKIDDNSKGSKRVVTSNNNLSEVPKPPNQSRRLSIAPVRMVNQNVSEFIHKPIAEMDLNPPLGVLATIGVTANEFDISSEVTNEKETIEDKVILSKLIDGPKRIIEGPKRMAVKSKLDSFDEKSSGIELKRATSSGPPPLPVEVLSRNKLENDDVNLYSIEAIRNMTEDSNWEGRLKGFDIISKNLKKLIILGEKPVQTIIDSYIDMAVNHLGDQHQKVAMESLQVIHISIESFHPYCISKLGILLTSLFHRLADRRMPVRDQANVLLNSARVTFDPVSIISALSPKIVEVPDRMKTAVIQFLVIIAPHCSTYFSNPQNVWAFLGRMAHVLGCGSTAPSTTLIVAGKRLLELVYNTSPSTILSQLAVMPLQQQTILKKMLSSISDIDMLVANAGKADRMKGGHAINDSSAKVKMIADESKKSKKNESSNNVLNLQKKIQDNIPLPSPPITKQQPPPPRDIIWLLDSLRPDAPFLDKKEAISEIKIFIRNGSEEFWSNSCAPLVSVILENFNPTLFDQMRNKAHAEPNTPALKPISITGFTPEINQQNENNHVHENENNHAHENALKAKLLQELSPKSPIIQANTNDSPVTRYYEIMHLLCKVLLILVRTRGKNIKVFMDLITSRLCQVAEFAPVAVILHCEQILADVGILDPLRFLHLLIPYSNINDIKGSSPQVRLISLHAMTSTMRNLSSPQILENINAIINVAKPSLSSNLVDLRKASIFLLVEIYIVIGDALHPYVHDIPTSQKKLLTIYIQKHIKQTV